MGRKIDMKKIEDVTKCQVTFSKRRSSLMKKANEIAVCCDVDVAFVAFSPSGRVSKFCNQKKIEDVLHRYVNLPADKRFHHINNVQGKMEKLKQLSHINGENSKLHYLDKQIENLELQIKKRGLELQILETDLRDYEIGAEQEPSLHQLSWCERNLNHSLQRVIARKMEQVELEKQSEQPISTSFNQNVQVSMTENPISGQILMQLDPWISPYSAKVRESIFQDLVDQTKQPMNENENTYMLNQPIPSNITNAPIQESPQPYIPSEQCLMMDQPAVFNFQDQNNVNALRQSLVMDQPLFNFHDQNNLSAYNASSVLYSDAIQMSTQTLCTIQDPRSTTITTTTNPSTSEMPQSLNDGMGSANPSTSEMPQSLYDGMGSALQCINSNLMSQFSNIEGSQDIGNVSVGGNTIFFNGNNPRNDNIEDFCTINVDQIHRNDNIEEFRAINVDQTHTNYQQQVPYNGHHHEQTSQEAEFNNLLLEENQEDNALWSLNRQKSSSLWEWDDLLLEENFNFQNLP